MHSFEKNSRQFRIVNITLAFIHALFCLVSVLFVLSFFGGEKGGEGGGGGGGMFWVDFTYYSKYSSRKHNSIMSCLFTKQLLNPETEMSLKIRCIRSFESLEDNGQDAATSLLTHAFSQSL